MVDRKFSWIKRFGFDHRTTTAFSSENSPRTAPPWGCSMLFGCFLAANLTVAFAETAWIRNVHDPSIIAESGEYTIFSTGAGVPIRKSTDLITWQPSGSVFDEAVPSWAKEKIPGSSNVWAPDISHYGNRFHLYYSVSTFGDQHSVIGYATTPTLDPSSPDFHWTDQGLVIESHPGIDDFNAIDPNLVLDSSGDPWLVFGSYWTGIKIMRIDPITGKRPETGNEIYPIASRPSTAIEAPFIIFRNSFYYLFVSFDQCCAGVDSTYNIRVGRASQITGPYSDMDGVSMMEGGGTLVLGSYDRYIGPGHNGVLRDSQGDFVVHHFYDGEAGGLRTLQIRPMFWTIDHWPLLGEPYEKPFQEGVDLRERLINGKWTQRVNFDRTFPLTFQANGRIGDPNGTATWTLDGNDLTLRWPSSGAPGGAWVDRCILAPDGSSYVGRNQFHVDIRGARDKNLSAMTLR